MPTNHQVLSDLVVCLCVWARVCDVQSPEWESLCPSLRAALQRALPSSPTKYESECLIVAWAPESWGRMKMPQVLLGTRACAVWLLTQFDAWLSHPKNQGRKKKIQKPIWTVFRVTLVYHPVVLFLPLYSLSLGISPLLGPCWNINTVVRDPSEGWDYPWFPLAT